MSGTGALGATTSLGGADSQRKAWKPVWFRQCAARSPKLGSSCSQPTATAGQGRESRRRAGPVPKLSVSFTTVGLTRLVNAPDDELVPVSLEVLPLVVRVGAGGSGDLLACLRRVGGG